MKRIFITILFILLTTSICYGAVSEDMSVYLRQDVFNAKMEAFMAEVRLGNEQLLNEMNKRFHELDIRFNRLESRIDVLDERTDGIKTTVYWGLGFMAIVIIVPSIYEFLKSLRKPSITLEDVERLIEANNAKMGFLELEHKN